MKKREIVEDEKVKKLISKKQSSSSIIIPLKLIKEMSTCGSLNTFGVTGPEHTAAKGAFLITNVSATKTEKT
ncbi:unnamed protein product [Arabis nemorensis]|uniref:Uncharacterized protein n=1 Tax=Arabis nemorensis TaxID=586526 RepID=A0A565ATM0_9BRAS|nr:unnamed protein product [Arabis nemorensis]